FLFFHVAGKLWLHYKKVHNFAPAAAVLSFQEIQTGQSLEMAYVPKKHMYIIAKGYPFALALVAYHDDIGGLEEKVVDVFLILLV
ncbi:hypothetical protein ACJX0J_037114, partial [Zea mays]